LDRYTGTKIEGDVAILPSGRRKKLPDCGFCGDPATMVCDHRDAEGKLCDTPICETDAVEVKPNIHHCPSHAGKKQEDV